MPYTEIDGVTLFFTDEGHGPYTLLLMHGLGTDSHDWDWVSPMLRERYRVIAMDLPGHGRSTSDQDLGLRRLADLAIGLARRCGCQALVPVGHSHGGAVAAAMAVEYPTEVTAAVEIDPAYGLPEAIIGVWDAGRQRWTAHRDDPDWTDDFSIPPSPVMSDFLITWLDRHAQALDPAVRWGMYGGLADAPERIIGDTPQAQAYLRRRQCPILAVHSLAGRGQWESALFEHPRSHAIEWEGSSHYLHIERPRELAFVIDGWLDSLTEG